MARALKVKRGEKERKERGGRKHPTPSARDRFLVTIVPRPQEGVCPVSNTTARCLYLASKWAATTYRRKRNKINALLHSAATLPSEYNLCHNTTQI